MSHKIAAYVGIDPGLAGAIALYARSIPFSGLPAVEIYDTPLKLDDRGKRVINMVALARILRVWAIDWDIKQVTVERVHAFPGQGVVSSFTFGFTSGSAQQAVASAGLPMTLVDPSTWKAMYGLRGGRANKDESRAKATELIPAGAHLWARKKDDGRAEAVLLAHYGSKLQC